MLLQLRVDSDSEEKMGDELTILMEAFNKKEKAGGQATLSVSNSSGKTKVKLVTTTTAGPPSVPLSTSSTPGRRHRRRGARARARRNLRAAAHHRQHCRFTLWKYDCSTRRNTHNHQRVSEQKIQTIILIHTQTGTLSSPLGFPG